MSMLETMVAQLVIKSAYGPDIVIDDPFGNPSATGGSVLMGILKPEIIIVPTVESIGVQQVAPWGQPGATKWPLVQIAAAVLLVVGAMWFVKR